MLCARFLLQRVAIDEDRSDPQPATKVDIRERVADHDAGGWVNIREFALRLVKHARQGLAAVALALVVRAEVEGVHMRTLCAEIFLQVLVNGFNVLSGIETERHAALV